MAILDYMMWPKAAEQPEIEIPATLRPPDL